MTRPRNQSQDASLLEKIRQQFDFKPYPERPLTQSPKEDIEALFSHNLITAYYRRNRTIPHLKQPLILDAGCGSGYKSLTLAEANPQAKIVGIDLSEKSIELARQRLEYHGFNQTEFYVLSIDNLSQLNYQFDYINVDEVLYLLPDPVLGLQAIKSVLKPDGIIRVNFHSSLQRNSYFKAQELFKILGLMDNNPQTEEIQAVRDMMKSLNQNVSLRLATWDCDPNLDRDDERILMNYLFQGDKGYTIPEVFKMLKQVNLEFISMLVWPYWELMTLFKEPDNLPTFIAMSLPEATLEEQLHLFELLQPIHRLLDFWCGHPCPQQSSQNLENWTDSDWQGVKIHLHPQLRTAKIRQDLCNCIENFTQFDMSDYLPNSSNVHLRLDRIQAAVLLPLWDRSCSLEFLVERWLQLQPLNPITLEPITWETAWNHLKKLVIELESALYLLLDQN